MYKLFIKVFFGKALCLMRVHRFGDVEEDFVRSTGIYRGFAELVFQKGIKKCFRSRCHFEKKVWRKVWTGPQIQIGFWRKMRPSKEAYINTLKYHQLMG